VADEFDRIARDSFINEILVGPCPRCGSLNTHDCEAPTFELEEAEEKIVKFGSECGVAREIDDNTIGHCDDCDYLGCLECEAELKIDSPVCVHWSICGSCGRTLEYPDDCPWKDEAESGDLLVNTCMCECPSIEKCTKCPYDDDIRQCRKIKGEIEFSSGS
jgi:hypothetical protein